MDADVAILGTGLVQSIVAAALSKAGFQVIHIDANDYYGGDEASLTVDELVKWAQEREVHSQTSDSLNAKAQENRFRSISYTSTAPIKSRQYSLSLEPTIIPSVGPFIDTLIASGVARYGGFKLLERVALFDSPGKVQMVPSGKEDIFRSKELSLVEKRRLMRFLMFAGDDFESRNELRDREQSPFFSFLREVFSLDEKSARAITYALAFCNSPSDPTLPALQRLRRYLRSTGRYGPSPFLVGHYGGLGELAQGFCRTSAVGGGIYILGREVASITMIGKDPQTDNGDSHSSPATDSGLRWSLRLEGFDQEVRAATVVTSPDYLPVDLQPKAHLITSPSPATSPRSTFARGIVLIDRPIHFISSGQATSSLEDPDPENEEDNEVTQTSQTNDYIDTALLVFPPSSVDGGSATSSVNVLITGEASMSAPRNHWILHFSMPLLESELNQSASELLRPYLQSTLSLVSHPTDTPPDVEFKTFTPQFSVFYLQHPPNISNAAVEVSSSLVVADSFSSFLPEISDQLATDAEICFWKVVEKLRSVGRKPRRKESDKDEASEDVSEEIDGFWPPLDDVGNEDD